MLVYFLLLFGDGANGGGGSSGPAPETKATPRISIRVGV